MERVSSFIIVLFFAAVSFARVPLTDQELALALAQFQYTSNYTEVASKGNESLFYDCWVYKKVLTTEYPSMDQPLEISVQMYIPNKNILGESKIPAVVILPPVGGVNFLDEQMAETFCSSKIAAFIITNDFAHVEDQASHSLLPVNDHEKAFHRVNAGVKSVMALAADHKNIDADKFGIFGVSLGGILGSFAMSTLPEISAGYFVVAGGDVPNILALSSQEKIATIRKKRMKEKNFTSPEEYEDYLRQHMKLDPLDFGRTMPPETIGMVIAQKDKSVPTANQITMHEAFGQPEAEFYKLDHVDTVIATLLYGSERRRIAKFFNERFKNENPRPNLFQFLMAF